MIFGDSKSTSSKEWTTALRDSLSAKTYGGVGLQNAAVAGESVATALAAMDAKLAAMPTDLSGVNYRKVLMNWGVNDGCADTATWETNYLAIIDKVHAKAPNADVYLMRPWMRGYACTAALHASIDTIVAARAFARIGPDEAIWLENGDNGATNTVDGVHYSTAGNAACAAQWQTVLGY